MKEITKETLKIAARKMMFELSDEECDALMSEMDIIVSEMNLISDIEDVDNSNNSWRKLEDGAENGYSWDAQTKRHGTILRITAEEAERLKEAFPIAE